jgi:pyruvate/2-oxoglutarate dehydrogenase complex dihydrolipoamide acyltransferase (E2) component
MRKDGRRIKTADPMYQVAMHIMAERNDALNMIKLHIKENPIHKYIVQKRQEGIHISHLTVVLAAFVRTLSQYPALNRFIVNKRLYARNEIAVGMVVLKPNAEDGTMNKMYFKPENTIFEIQEIVNSYINQNRETGKTNSTDKLISLLLSIPGLCRLGVNIFKWMDKHNLLPRKIIEASPFHCTMTITNLASIKTNYIYHHVYNFGTTSMIMAMGNMEEVPRTVKGEIVLEKCIPIGLVMDERIVSGHDFANAFRIMEKYLHNPELLETPPEKIVEDIR